jgi:calcium/calmodulin-dependent protein kinase I
MCRTAQIFEKILTANYEFDPECWDEVSENVKDFISHLLMLAPSDRMTAVQALDHPWLQYYFPSVNGSVASSSKDGSVASKT